MQELMFVNVYMSYKSSIDIVPWQDEVNVIHEIVYGTISTITERSIHGERKPSVSHRVWEKIVSDEHYIDVSFNV